MRIITVSPGYNFKFRDFFYSFDKKIINGLIRAGHAVIPYSDRDIADSVARIRAIGAPLANSKLLAIVKSYMADMVVLLQADLITNGTLSQIKQYCPECLIVNIDCDLLETEKLMRRLTDRRGLVDATLVTYGGAPLDALRSKGLRAGHIPNPTDLSLENADCFSWPDKFFDLVYIASAPSNSARWALIKEVAASAPNLRVGSFGSDRKRVFGQDYFSILRGSRTSLNWSRRNDAYLYASDRIAQLFGAGSCVCILKGWGFEQFFGAEHAVFFSDADDLCRQLTALKANGAWAEIGRAGQQRYRSLFNEVRIANYIVDFACGNSLSKYEWEHV